TVGRAVPVARHVQPVSRRRPDQAGGTDPPAIHQDAHAPLDGLPIRKDVTYVVVGRDPRDAAVSFEHHAANLDYDHFLELRARVMGSDGVAEFGRPGELVADPAARWRAFVRSDAIDGPPTLPAVLHHLHTAWERRHDHNVLMLHFADMKEDLVGEMRRLAAPLGIDLTAERASELARHAGLDQMRARASELVPNVSQDLWK